MDDLISRELLIRRLEAWDKGANAIPNYAWKVIRELTSVSICTDAISRTDAIRVASGYCHWSNIPKELAKLPSVNPIPCEDAISRQAVLEGLARIAKAKAKSDAQKAMMGRSMFFVERLPSVSVKEKVGKWTESRISESVLCECSECGYTCGAVSMNYCPNCGAKMGVEE